MRSRIVLSQENFIAYSQHFLLKDKDAILYLKSRGVTSKQVADFKIGYSGPGFKIGETEVYAGYLIFPLVDEYGSVIGFSTKSVKGGKGYYKILFDETKEGFLFGINLAIEPMYNSRTVAIVEGIFDTINVQQFFPAVLGMITSGLRQKQKQVLDRYIERVIYVSDNDSTGQESRSKFLKYNATKYNITVPDYPYKDPSEWYKNRPQEFKDFWTGLKEIFEV